MEPTNFILANEDHSLYSFDMRNMTKALMVHKDHVSAVMDVAFSPSGREFVSGSYDRTVRLFNSNSGRSKEVYHTKRMQRVFSVNFSIDARFIFSGSDDTNIRIWKAESSKSIGITGGRVQRKQQFNATIKNRYQHMPEIKRISRDKPLPKNIKKAISIRHIQADSERRRQDNRKRHSNQEDLDANLVPERKRVVLKSIS
jgi:WD repeat and SOF domain-containing protein 1